MPSPRTSKPQEIAQPFPTTNALYEAQWLPAEPGTYSDRPQSPERLKGETAAAGAGKGSSAGASAGELQYPSFLPPFLSFLPLFRLALIVRSLAMASLASSLA
jgi:hypothetical protein